jgi:hypothetical protein
MDIPVSLATDDDPAPLPPVEPDAFSCCGNDCGEACVWTIYWRAQQDYDRAVQAWRERQVRKDQASGA